MNEQENAQPPSTQGMPTPDPVPRHHMNNPLSVMQQGEQTICEIKRHPIGLLGIYAMSGALLVVLAAVAFVIVPHSTSSDNRGQAVMGASLLFFLIAAIILVFVYIANKVYWGNSWVVTSDSITQMTQTSLFHRQASQLSLGNLEDVTSEKNGILANMFNFGVLRAETAGERSKFMFLYCPTPDYYAQKILAAREQFEQIHRGGKQAPSYQQASPIQTIPHDDGQSSQPIPQPMQQQQDAQSYQPPEPQISPERPSQMVPTAEPPFYYGDDAASQIPPPATDTDIQASPPSAPEPFTEQAQPPAYDPGAYRPLYPDTPPSFNHSESGEESANR
ncbi:MAG TPA: hypothetical protein VHB72_02470 [Candidatus Saccharimonadales bacterium]|nr:hypothetical protein [Candidatus Saccharimonadales bacterium]